MLSYKKVILSVAFLIISVFSFAQGVSILPVYQGSNLQIKVQSGERCITKFSELSASDKVLTFTAFSEELGELVIPEMKVDLVRNGRKLAEVNGGNILDISNLVSQASHHDVLRFYAEKVFYKTEDGLKPYAEGGVSLTYHYAAKPSSNMR